MGPSRQAQMGAHLPRFWHVWAASIQDFWTVRMVSSGLSAALTGSGGVSSSIGRKKADSISLRKIFIGTSCCYSCSRWPARHGGVFSSLYGPKEERCMEARHRSDPSELFHQKRKVQNGDPVHIPAVGPTSRLAGLYRSQGRLFPRSSGSRFPAVSLIFHRPT